jgi:dsRNA-specific ribonuclease
MRYCQQIKIDLPQYPIDFHNNGIFGVSVVVDGHAVASGSAKNKKQAEQNAAQEAIRLLGIV